MDFKPGTYKKGNMVSVEGTLWEARRDINYATAYPKEGIYWTRVENTGNIQVMIDAVPQWGKKKITLLDGYNIPSLLIQDKSVVLEGDVMTKIEVAGGVKIKRTWAGAQVTFRNLEIRGNNVPKVNGLECYDVARFDNVTVRNFAGRGWLFNGHFGDNTDTSQSLLLGCKAIENGSDGLYAVGGDSNVINLIGFDMRDNGGVGIHDASFLGINAVGCMGHNNKRGHYWVTNNNSRAVFTGCYAEGDSPLSFFAGRTRVVGGIHFKIILEKLATAHIEGKELSGEVPNLEFMPYQEVKIERLPNKDVIKFYKWEGQGYQWRLYSKGEADFIDKSDADLPTIEAAFNECIKKHNLITS